MYFFNVIWMVEKSVFFHVLFLKKGDAKSSWVNPELNFSFEFGTKIDMGSR